MSASRRAQSTTSFLSGSLDGLSICPWTPGCLVCRNPAHPHLTLRKLRSGKSLTPADPESLEELLARTSAGGPEDMERAVANADGLGHFVPSLVGLDQEAVQKHSPSSSANAPPPATASQIDFVNLIIGHLTRHGEMNPNLLFEPPFTDSAPRGPRNCSPRPDNVTRLLGVIRSMNNSVVATA